MLYINCFFNNNTKDKHLYKKAATCSVFIAAKKLNPNAH